MPLHNHLLSFAEESPTKSLVDDYSTSHPEMLATEADPLLSRQDPSHAESETRTLAYACVLTTFFFLVELVGGYIAGSLAIMSDAAHLLSDLAGFAISLLAVAVSRLPPNAQMSFGFARAEVLGAFVSILFIWALTAVLVIFAIERLFNPSPVDGPIMLALGIIGLLVNIVLGCVLGHGHDHVHDHAHAHNHAHGHDHSHAHATDHHTHNSHDHSSDSHDHTHQVSRTGDKHCDSQCDVETGSHSQTEPSHSGVSGASEHTSHDNDNDNKGSENPEQPSWRSLLFGSDQKSVNLRAAYLHVLGDALQNIGVIVAAIIMTLNPSLSFIDPLCTLVFAGIVLVTTKDLAKETMTVLMEGTPPAVKLDDIYAALIQINGVASVGDLHAWSITPRRPALSVHLYQTEDIRGHDLIKDAQKVLAEKFGIFHATIQVNCDTSDCCDDGLYFEAQSGQKNCISYNHNRTSSSSLG